MFALPVYTPPDFNRPDLAASPAARFKPARADGLLPDDFHATSNYPEYVHLGDGRWLLAPESRMDAVLVLKDQRLEVLEPRRIRKGDPVAIGRSENGEEGIYVHTTGFGLPVEQRGKFSFRSHGSREAPFSRCYDELYQILRHDRQHGHIVWVLGPAVAFDRDSRDAMRFMVEQGYCHALMAGNALATHDLEAAFFGTGLGQDIYTQAVRPGGHYNHLETINRVQGCGSIRQAIQDLGVRDGIMAACVERKIPYVLAGSIRDDGPLPGVVTGAAEWITMPRSSAGRVVGASASVSISGMRARSRRSAEITSRSAAAKMSISEARSPWAARLMTGQRRASRSMLRIGR